jgi:hypothetical protein
MKTKRTIRFILICLLIATSKNITYGQNSLYALLSNNDILRIDPLNCNTELVISGNKINTDVKFQDIACEQGELYAIGSSLLYKINPISGQVDFINLGNGFDCNGLTSNQSGFLYAAGAYLSRIDITNNQLLKIGDLGYSSLGDLEIVDGKFYISAQDSFGNPKLIKVTESPFTVSEICSIPSYCYGISSHNSLSNNEIYLSTDSSLIIVDVSIGTKTVSCPNIFKNLDVYGLTKGPNNLKVENLKDVEPIITYNSSSNTILISCPLTSMATYCLRNCWGQIVEQSNINDLTTEIETSNYSKGLYFVTVNNREFSKTQKVIFK